MLRFVLYLLTALDLALVVLGDGQIHPSRLPNLPPPPTFTPVGENNTILVPIGENIVVHENVRVTMDCIELIQDLIDLGEANPHVTWIKNTAVIGRNATEVNVFISGDERYCIVSSTQLAVGGQLGTTGNYTCRVCGGDGTVDCVSKTSSQIVCGVPHIQRPGAPATVFPTFIQLTCGQNVTVNSFINITVISFSCTVFNGSEPWILSIYKDGELTNYTGPTFTINNPTDEIYGTFTFVVVTEYCGSATVISRILQSGVPPDIDEGPPMTRPDTITEGNKRVTIGSPAYVLLGYNVTIDCNASGTPPIFITWVHNELIIAGDVNTITITDAKDGDVITCRADNNIGFDEERTTINVIACDLTCDTVGTLKEENCSCQCLPGYTGSKCETNIDECVPDPCQNGGTCTDDINGYNCACVPGYTGSNCETNIDECATDPCLNDGTCTDGINKYTCECVAGFTGSDCETNIDECAPNPCLNGGTCIDGINSYTCNCAEDFTNVNCFEYIGACPDNYRTVSVSFDQSSYTVSEGDGSVEFKLALSSPLGCNCYARVVVTTDDATAKRDSDYEHEDDYIEVIFINGMVTSEPFYIKMTDNDDFEDDKIFRITIDPLSLPYGTTLGSGGSANVIIKDDEEATVRFKEVDIAASESDGLVKPVLVLSKALSKNITIKITTAPGSTSAECDYDYEPFNITIPAGEKEWRFDAKIYDDDIYETNEYFVLVIDEDSLPDRIEREQPYTSTVTIEDDEEKITVNFDDPSYNIKESDGVVEISLSLDKPSPCCLHLLVEFVNGTAIGQGVDYDYDRRKLNITFPAGVTCSRFNVPIINDELSENDETFYIIIIDKSLPYGITIGDDGKTNVTIVDNDVYVSFASQTFENHEDEGSIEVEVKLDKIAQTDTIVTVDVDRANGAEGNGTDYDFEAHNVTIQAGTDSAKFYVTIIDDLSLEHDETFNLTITHLYSSLPYEIYVGQPNKTKIIILDNEYIVTFNEPSYIVNEADITLVLAVKVNKKIAKDIHMTFLYNGLIATENEDYTVITRNATIEAGDTHYELTINIIDDDRLEDNELVRITIRPSVIPTNHNPGSIDITIIDDDDYKIYFEKATYIDKKNEQTIPVLLLTYPSNHDELVYLNMSKPPFNVTIDEVDGTARGGSEGMDDLDYYYVFKNRTISFKDGEKMKSLSEIRSIDDNLVEGDETFNLIINSESLPENFIAERNGTTTIVIQNDDVCFLRLDSGGMSFSKPLAADISMNITYFDKQRNTTVTTTDTIMAAETDSRDPVPLIVQTHDIEKIEVFIPVELYIPDDERQNIKSSSPEKIFLTKPT